MSVTDWLKRRILAGRVEGDLDWPITDVSGDGRRARCKFDGLRVEISNRRATVSLMLGSRKVAEYSQHEWVDFEGGEILNVSFNNLEGSIEVRLS